MNGAERMDLAIRGGTIVTASSRYEADIGVRDGLMAQIGGNFEAERDIDASGRLVMPGGIDMHVHPTPATLPDGEELGWAYDFGSGTRAAAAGGITTVGNITFPRPGEALLDLVERVTQEAEDKAVVTSPCTRCCSIPLRRRKTSSPSLRGGGTRA